MAKDLAIILNNGSLNSAVVTTLAAQRYRPVMVYAELGPTPLPRNRGSYDQQVAHFKPYREHTLAMPFVGAVAGPGGSDPQAADPRHSGSVAPQLVHLLPLVAAAAPLAAHYQASVIYVGLRVGGNVDDLAQATEYVQIFNELLQHPYKQPELELTAPLLELEAWQVVDVGVQVSAPLDKSWSCVEQAEQPCGTCRGCRVREQAFAQAVKNDPRGVKR